MQERKRARQRVVASTVVRLKQVRALMMRRARHLLATAPHNVARNPGWTHLQEAEERSVEKQLRQGGRREEIR
jgi:hypothetical protein